MYLWWAGRNLCGQTDAYLKNRCKKNTSTALPPLYFLFIKKKKKNRKKAIR